MALDDVLTALQTVWTNLNVSVQDKARKMLNSKLLNDMKLTE